MKGISWAIIWHRIHQNPDRQKSDLHFLKPRFMFCFVIVWFLSLARLWFFWMLLISSVVHRSPVHLQRLLTEELRGQAGTWAWGKPAQLLPTRGNSAGIQHSPSVPCPREGRGWGEKGGASAVFAQVSRALRVGACPAEIPFPGLHWAAGWWRQGVT